MEDKIMVSMLKLLQNLQKYLSANDPEVII